MDRRPPSVTQLPDGAWQTRIRLGQGARCRYTLLGCPNERAAERRAALLAELASQLTETGRSIQAPEILQRVARAEDERTLADLRALVRRLCAGAYDEPGAPVISSPTTTFRALAEQWSDGELHERYPDHVKKKKSASDDRWRFERHIFPTVGGVPLPDFRLEHAELVMQRLPKALSAASRRHVAQLVHRVLAMAVYPCRVIQVSPIPRGWLPSPGGKKGYPILYAAEDAQLLAKTSIPLDFRILYGFLHREGMRRSEAIELTWRDVDLEHGVVRLDDNKTAHPRWWKMAAGVAAALGAWRRLRADLDDSSRVFVEHDSDGLDIEHLAQHLRDHLREAGVLRHELHEKGVNRGRLTVHCLRHSFVTRSLACGKNEDWVRQRTGHISNELLRYREGARSLSELELGDVLPLVDAIPELAEMGHGAATEGAREPELDAKLVGVGHSMGQAQNDIGSNLIQFLNESELVHEEGLEPPHLAVPEPKSGASANSATRAMRRREV